MLSRHALRYEGIIEARMASSRVPGKMLMEISGKPGTDTYGRVAKGLWIMK